MGDTVKSVSLDAAKDRLEAILARLNDLVTEKNNALMIAHAVSDERNNLAERVGQLEALNAELDMAVAHQALHNQESDLDKQAIMKLRDEFEKLKGTNVELKSALAAAHELAKAQSNGDLIPNHNNSDSEHASLKEELANKVRQVNALESEALTIDDMRRQSRVKIDGLIGRVEIMMEQAHG